MARARDLGAEIAAAEARLVADRFGAVETLRALHEAAARAAIGVEAGELAGLVRRAVDRGITAEMARRAEDHLANAERFQWEIGTWATGGGEGLASMGEVRELQLARAWLLSALAEPDADARARALLAEIDHDPNDVARRLAPLRDALRACLSHARR